MGPKVKLVGPYYIRTFGGTSRYLQANVARQDHCNVAEKSPARWYAGSLQ